MKAKWLTDEAGRKVSIEVTHDDGTVSHVPPDPNNMDYQRLIHGDPDTGPPQEKISPRKSRSKPTRR